eukprot:2223345-Rhodomonas_salina.1
MMRDPEAGTSDALHAPPPLHPPPPPSVVANKRLPRSDSASTRAVRRAESTPACVVLRRLAAQRVRGRCGRALKESALRSSRALAPEPPAHRPAPSSSSSAPEASRPRCQC